MRELAQLKYLMRIGSVGRSFGARPSSASSTRRSTATSTPGGRGAPIQRERRIDVRGPVTRADLAERRSRRGRRTIRCSHC